MSLDITLVKNRQVTGELVEVSVQEHWDLLQMLTEKTPLLRRMNDYYQEVQFSASEVPALLAELTEIKQLNALVFYNNRLDGLITKIQELLLKALTGDVSIFVLPD